MCDYITPASSPPLSEPSEPVPGVGVGVEGRPFSLSMGCYWWGEVMDLPTVLTGTLRINQTVGKTQPAIPPLSRLNCHFISFIYGGSALFWTPPLSILPLKMPLLFFFLPYIVLWQPIYAPVLPSSLFSRKHSILSTTQLFPACVFMWTWRCEQPVSAIVQWTKGWMGSAVLWSSEGLSTGWAFNIRRSSAGPSSSALPAEPYLSWLSSSNSPLGLWLSHLVRKLQPKPAFVLEGRDRNALCVLAGKD